MVRGFHHGLRTDKVLALMLLAVIIGESKGALMNVNVTLLVSSGEQWYWQGS